MYNLILFDLDGTLTDPGEGITNSVAYALAQWGIRVDDRRTLYRFIGPPLKDSFMEFYGFSEEEAIRAVEAYRVYFREKGMLENRVYPGVESMLQALKDDGKTLAVATSKPESFAKQILEHFGLADFFDLIAGATMDSTRSKKADVIAYALNQLVRELSHDRHTTVMVGDRAQDIQGALANGLDSIGVLFGYGDQAELESAGATRVVSTVNELKAVLLSS